MKIEQFKSLFPLKGRVTQEIIDSASIGNPLDCIGALTLRAALGENNKYLSGGLVAWGSTHGANFILGNSIRITTENNVNMMRVTAPQDVTFIIEKIEEDKWPDTSY